MVSVQAKVSLARLIGGLFRDESGQELIEYALIILAVLLAAVAGSQSLSGVLSGTITSVFGKILAAFP